MIKFSQGGRGAGYRAGSEEDTYDHEGKRMFHVRGSSDMNAKAMQVCTNLETFTDTSPLELNSKTDS